MSEVSEQNVYAAPESEVEAEQIGGEVHPEFHVTGPIKVFIFYVLSFGLSSLVWFYQQWRRQKLFGGEDCWPVARAFFSIFFAYPLFTNVKILAEDKGIKVGWSAGLLATFYIVASILANVSDKLVEGMDISAGVSLLITFIILFVPGIVLFMVQKIINQTYANVLDDLNEKFSLINWVFVILLVVFWALGIYGLTLE